MKFSEAIESVAAVYVPGTVQFWASQPKDLWAEMLDGVELLLRSENPEAREAAGEALYKRAKELVELYKASGRKRPEGYQPIDAFLMGPGGHLRAAESRRKKQCYRCAGKEGLSLEAYGPELLQVRLVCPGCKARAAEKSASRGLQQTPRLEKVHT